MKINRIHIENFRSIKCLDVELAETTVFIGPNNAGKTAIIDALRIALTRRWGQRGTGFTEYDVHLATEKDDPKKSPGVTIEIHAEEASPGEWPEGVQQALDEIAQLDPKTGKSSITLNVKCAWNEAEAIFEPRWAFLNAARQTLVAGAARRLNLERFWQYVPVFYLGALRDAEDEFSVRSQFWGRLLKAIEVPPKLEARVHKVLDLLNNRLLDADPRLEKIATTLSGATRVSARDRDGQVDLRLLPLKAWDLLSKAELILRNEPDWPWLPLQRQGQGVQSLSVIFLFQAFVEHLLKELFEPESTPVLALEEPETHLHPQAARTLWSHVSVLPGQKIITTHSPYFVQHVPFRDIRLVRLTQKGTEVFWLPAKFSAGVPHRAELDPVVAESKGVLEYDPTKQVLTVKGTLSEKLCRKLLVCYPTAPNKEAIHGTIRDLQRRSALYVSDDELQALETFARRIRGEIFFANRWLIVEGQAEYLIVHALARQIGYDLDEHGVSLIDAVNNGHPAIFAALGRALGIPWLALFDRDEAGNAYIRGIIDRGFDQAFVDDRCKLLPSGNLEQQFLADGLETDLRLALQAVGQKDAMSIDRTTLESRLSNYKTDYSAAFAVRIAADPDFAKRMPELLRNTIMRLKGLT
jgi:putative ATP-dependent endonuclease of the OLD family